MLSVDFTSVDFMAGMAVGLIVALVVSLVSDALS